MAGLYSLCIVLITYLTYVSCGPCPDDTWRYSPHSNKCYKLFNEKIGWTLAEFKCAFKGAHQISVHNSVDNQFIAELARQADIVWLGMAQFGTNQNYVWADHTSYDYENWHAKHNYRKPVYNKGKKCAKLEGHSQTWMQSCCKVPAAYICERNGSGSPPPVTFEERTSIESTVDNNNLRRFRFQRRRL